MVDFGSNKGAFPTLQRETGKMVKTDSRWENTGNTGISKFWEKKTHVKTLEI